MTNTMMCLSLLLFHESRGESLKGQVAVMEVVMNRVQDSRLFKTFFLDRKLNLCRDRKSDVKDEIIKVTYVGSNEWVIYR